MRNITQRDTEKTQRDTENLLCGSLQFISVSLCVKKYT